MRPPFMLPHALFSRLYRMMHGMMEPVSRSYPEMRSYLSALEIEMDEAEYFAATFVNALVVGLFAGAIFYMAAVQRKMPEGVVLGGAAFAFIVLAFFYGSYLLAFPRWINGRRADLLEENLLFAIRHLMVQTTAGVPFFDALASASKGYGAVSEEFGNIVTKVNAGYDLADALEDSAARNSSKYYQRIMWQVANSQRAGYPIGQILKELVSFLAFEHQIKLKKFGSETNVITLFYMGTCIIMPTLGLILVVILSSFGMFSLTTATLGVFVFLVLVFNMIFLGIIQSRRPRGVI